MGSARTGSNPVAVVLLWRPENPAAFSSTRSLPSLCAVSSPSCPVARLAQLVERKTLNLVVVGSSPTVGDFVLIHIFPV